ncbi:MAG: GNAT family N-acetyltransferase [Gemmatimonadetes bacterium]|nr:GNAT family N-acetyltransferase [Gemmatimonadota bacterium]
MAEIRTKRLTLLPFAPGDEKSLLALFTREEVRRYLLDGVVVGRNWVSQEIEDSRSRFATGSAGLWSIREAHGSDHLDQPDGSPIIGFAGFRPFFDPPQLQLLYGLEPAYWGRGLAREAARAAVRFGFDVCGFPRVIAATDAPNRASVRVVEALGLTLLGATAEGAWGETLTYGLDRAEWERSATVGHDDG